MFGTLYQRNFNDYTNIFGVAQHYKTRSNFVGFRQLLEMEYLPLTHVESPITHVWAWEGEISTTNLLKHIEKGQRLKRDSFSNKKQQTLMQKT